MGKAHPIHLAVFVLVTLCFGILMTAKADTITFSVTGTGISVPTAPPTPTNIDFSFNATYDSPLGTLSIAALGSVNLTVVNPDGSNPNAGTFTFSVPGGDSFAGTFVGSIQQATAQGDTTYLLNYTIISGTGIFTGATGTGTSAGDLNVITGATTDRLTLTILAPGLTAPVPEPATMLLLGAGLAGVGAVTRKRRKDEKLGDLTKR